MIKKRIVEIIDVLLFENNPEYLWGFSIDRPKNGDIYENNIELKGWVLSKKVPASAVVLSCEGENIWSITFNDVRGDVSNVFPNVSWAKNSGFLTNLQITELPKKVDLLLEAVLTDERKVGLGIISWVEKNLTSASLSLPQPKENEELQRSRFWLKKMHENLEGSSAKVHKFQSSLEALKNLSNKEKPLAAIICGFEQGGTTLISEILRRHPKLDSGFEGGILLGKKPSAFPAIQPYCNMLKSSWEINDEELNYICQTNDWLEAYKRLLMRAKAIKNKSGFIYDKTPSYMNWLYTVLEKVPTVPCIVIVRDPRAVLWSWAKRSKLSKDEWIKTELKKQCDRYLSYARGWQNAVEKGLESQILLIQYESICTTPIREAKKIFEFIGFGFDASYLSLEGKKYNNVHGNQISGQYLTEYKNHFSDEVCQEILNATQEFKEWFWQ